MSKTVQLSDLRTQVRDRFEAYSDQISDSTLTAWINASYYKLYNLLLRHSPDWYLASADQNLTISTREYTLPAACYRVRRVDVLLSGSEWTTLSPYMLHEENALDGFRIASASTYRYLVTGGKIRIAPLPNATVTNGLRIFYNPVPTAMSNGTDTMDGVSGWEEYVILDTGIKVFHKLDWDATPLVLERRDIEMSVKSMAGGQDAGNPRRVRDVYAERASRLYNRYKGIL